MNTNNQKKFDEIQRLRRQSPTEARVRRLGKLLGGTIHKCRKTGRFFSVVQGRRQVGKGCTLKQAWQALTGLPAILVLDELLRE